MPASPHLPPATIAQHTAESLYLEHGRPRSWVYWITLLGLVGVMIALPLTKVDVTVSAPGIVRPATERAELRIPVVGQIAEVLAHDNDYVTAGQPLLIIRSRDLNELIALNQNRQRDKSDLIADLLLLTKDPELGIPQIAEGDSPNTRQLDNRSVEMLRPKSINEPSASLNSTFKTHELRADFAQEKKQLATIGLTISKASRELTRAANLALEGLITDRELDQARDDHSSAVAEQSTLLAATHSRWESRLHEEQTNLDTLRTEENRLTEQFAQNTIRAPVTGTVQGLAGLFAGAWLSASQLIGSVSPDDKLLVETLVSPRDVGLLSIGQPARLQIDAFPYTQWGLLDGAIDTIADDSRPPTSSDSSGGFKVTLHTSAPALHLANGTKGDLRKGMTLNARFVIARRSLLQVLHEDVSMWLNPADNRRRP